MAENSAYFEAITAARAMLLDDPQGLDHTLSLETQAEMMREHVGDYMKDNFPSFVKFLRLLPSEDQELLLSYYMLGKPQWCLAKLYRSTQTVCSVKLRMAVKKLGTIAIFRGHPTVDSMCPVLEKAGINHLIEKSTNVSTAMLVVEYRAARSFAVVAKKLGVMRPQVRRALSTAAKFLLASSVDEEVALGAYIFGLIDKASSSGQGYSQRKLDKHTHVYRQDPSLLGAFRISVLHPEFEHVLTSRACF